MNHQPTRHHPDLVALHWLLALALVIGALFRQFSLKDRLMSRVWAGPR